MTFKFVKSIGFGFILYFAAMTPAFSGELVSWSNTVSSNFSAEQCVTVHGTPGTPRKCAPSYTQRYPCPTFKHPGKKCHHTIAGPCSPAVPGTPDLHQCANIKLGTFSIAVDGGVFADFAGIDDSEVAVQTTVHVSLFGKTAVVPMSCKIEIGKTANICLNLLTRTFSGTGYTCEIGGAKVASITYPGVTTNLCMDVTVSGAAKKPSGTITARIEADVEFGSATVAGHKLSMGSKGWDPALFSVKF